MTPQQYAMENNMSVQQAKRALGMRRSKHVFAAHSAPKPLPLVQDNVPDTTPAVATMSTDSARIAA